MVKVCIVVFFTLCSLGYLSFFSFQEDYEPGVSNDVSFI